MSYRVEDLAVLVLQNLQDIEEEQLISVCSQIESTRCSYLKPVFDFALAFYKQNSKMPDEDYMTIHWESALYKTDVPYHPQFISDFVKYIQTEAVAVKTQQALNRGDFNSAMTIIQSVRNTDTSPILTMNDVLKMWKENRKEFSHGMKLGIPELDDVYKFLGYKTLNVLAAPPANFKTTVAVSAAFDAIYKQNLNVVYLTLEDTSEIIFHNMLAAYAGSQGINVTAEEIKRYLLPEEKCPLMDQLVEGWNKDVKGNFAALCSREVGSFTPANISKKLDEIYESWGKKLDVVIVDHFNIMNDPVPGLQLQGPSLAKYYVRYMTNLAISFGHKGFILIGLSQINREGQVKLEKGKELTGVEFADTSELHRSATTATSIFADDNDRATGMIKLKIIKNRLGSQGNLFIVPIYPQRFKVGADEPVLKSMTVEEFETLGQQSTAGVVPVNADVDVDALLTEIGAK